MTRTRSELPGERFALLLDRGDELSVGDRVRHDKWGEGTVRTIVGVGDRAEATVVFDGAGEKRLLLAWAPLVKV